MGNCVSAAPEDVLGAAHLGQHAHIHKREGNIKEEYEQKGFLGDGVEGQVWLGQKGDQVWAIKTVSKNKPKEVLDDVVHEVEMLNILGRHPSIVHVEEVWEDKGSIHIVQEFCRGGSLVDYMERHKEHMSMKRIAEIIRNMCEAIAHCHARGVMHRDLKQENIMFLDNTLKSPVKIIDFGNSLFLSRGKTTEGYAGTTFSAAPEIEQGNRYDHKADIFSLGTLVYFIISGGYPFGYSESGYQQLLEAKYYKCKKPPFTDDSVKLIAKMLTKDPKKRVSAAKCMKQPFLALDKDHAHSTDFIKQRYEQLSKTMADNKKRLEIQAKLVQSLCPDSEEEKEDLLDNLVALEAWMVDFQAVTKMSLTSRSITKSEGSELLTNQAELAVPTITSIENFYLDLRANGFNGLADGIHEKMKDELEYTINLDEVLSDLRKQLEAQNPLAKYAANPDGGEPIPIEPNPLAIAV